MNKPVIGITVASMGSKYVLNQAYCAAIGRAGGVPVLLCPESGQPPILQGVVLTGGGDFQPASGVYGVTKGAIWDLDPRRDAYERKLIHGCIKAGIPILGICRGMQAINLALGGTLYRDLGQAGFPEQHVLQPPCRHAIAISKGRELGRLLGNQQFVNSSHHQGVERLAKGLFAGAWSPGGVLEALEDGRGAILGVQWHPERMGMTALFWWIVRRASTYLAKDMKRV